jgi:hypothetical protein
MYVKQSRVPDTFQLVPFSTISAFLSACVFNNLRIFKADECFDSPRLHHNFGDVS